MFPYLQQTGRANMGASAETRQATASAAIPAFVNPSSGRANAALEALDRTPGFDIHLTAPEQSAFALRRAMRDGASRVVVAGGDGTIASTASVLAGSPTALAVLPAGTLNHFARSHGIPTDPQEALRVAMSGRVKPVDVGYMNERLFLNTSSVGAYVRFVLTRDRLQRCLPYWLATLVAGMRILRSLRNIVVTLEVGGEAGVYRVPLAFVAVGERNLTTPKLGWPTGEPGGALHVVVPRGRRQARRFVRAYARVDRGVPIEARPLGLESALVQRFRLDLPMPVVNVSADGEIRRERTPLEYRLAPGALNLVVPEA
jgi:diacylglycerol kinase family enzyme